MKVHIAEVGAGRWGMLTFSTKVPREEQYILFFREGLSILQADLVLIMPPEGQGYLDTRFALQNMEAKVTIIIIMHCCSH